MSYHNIYHRSGVTRLKQLKYSLSFFISLLFSTGNAQQYPADKLPVHAFEVKGSTKPMILYITGDGGWNTFSQNLTQEFTKQQYSVIALDAREYFWDERTPDEFSTAIEELLDYYSTKWKKNDFTIVGYSFGADVGAFLLNRLKPATLKKLKPSVLLSPSASTDFVVRVSELLGFSNADRKYKVLPELTKSKVVVLCVFGEDEETNLKENITETTLLKIKTVSGSHRFNNDMNLLSMLITQAIEQKETKSP